MFKISNILIIIAFIVSFAVLFVMGMFFKFHIWLVSSNMTTIENMNKERSGYNPHYNMGAKYNWLQVFGNNKLLWPFPVFMDSGKPIGDGVIWPTKKS